MLRSHCGCWTPTDTIASACTRSDIACRSTRTNSTSSRRCISTSTSHRAVSSSMQLDTSMPSSTRSEECSSVASTYDGAASVCIGDGERSSESCVASDPTRMVLVIDHGMAWTARGARLYYVCVCMDVCRMMEWFVECDYDAKNVTISASTSIACSNSSRPRSTGAM